MKTNYTSKTMKNSKKAAQNTASRLERFLNRKADYLANYAVVKGGLSPFQNGFFVA